MPIAIVMLLLDLTLVVHVVKTGRNSVWILIILMVPGLGALAYVVAELIPEWFGSYQGQQATRRVSSALNPEKAYRAFKGQVDIADTIANRVALAEECLALGKFDEAVAQYDAILARPLGEEPTFVVGRAGALLGLGRFEDTVAALDDLRMRWPDFQSQEGHLLYARALEGAGRNDEALEEYRAVCQYYAGAEPRVRYGLLLRRVGREAEGFAALAEVIKQMRRAPPYARKAQREWVTMAEKALRA